MRFATFLLLVFTPLGLSAQPRPVELVVRHGTVVTVDATRRVNAHGHAPMVMFRGVADDLRLMDWLTKYIFPAEAKNVSAPFVKTATRLAALEMIRSGTTTFVDMYYFEDQVAEAAKEAGIRGVLGSTVIEVPGGAPDAKTVPEALASAERFLERWAGDPLIVPAVAPHSAYLCSPETLKSVKALADRYQA